MQVAKANPEIEQPLAETNGHGRRRHNLQLLMANLQSSAEKQRGVTIVLTSATRGEGVSHVAQLFAVELARHTCRRTLIIDADRLRSLRVEDFLRMPQNCHRTNIENVWMLPSRKAQPSEANGNGHVEAGGVLLPMPVRKMQDEVNDPVDSLRVNFDNILIDCRSLKHSSEAAVWAASADGVVVVVEAGRTRHEEILNAQRTIEVAGGKLLGFVLNKRRYPVPDWLYRRL